MSVPAFCPIQNCFWVYRIEIRNGGGGIYCVVLCMPKEGEKGDRLGMWKHYLHPLLSTEDNRIMTWLMCIYTFDKSIYEYCNLLQMANTHLISILHSAEDESYSRYRYCLVFNVRITQVLILIIAEDRIHSVPLLYSTVDGNNSKLSSAVFYSTIRKSIWPRQVFLIGKQNTWHSDKPLGGGKPMHLEAWPTPKIYLGVILRSQY